MIQLMKLNGESIFVNPDLVRTIESTPDTLLVFIDGQRMLVRDAPEAVRGKIIAYRRVCAAQNNEEPASWNL